MSSHKWTSETSTPLPHEGPVHRGSRQINIQKPDTVFLTDLIISGTEIFFQYLCGLTAVRYDKPDIAAVFPLHFFQTLLFQQHPFVNNADIISQKRNLRQNVAGDQNGLSADITKLPDKGTDFRNTDRIQSG